MNIYIKKFDSIDSTNSKLKQDLLKNKDINKKIFKNLIVYSAEHQTNGRGRGKNKYWNSPYGENIYVSLGWRVCYSQLKNITTLSIKAAQIIIDLLEELSLKNIKFKWPNDIFVNSKKISGILIELIKLDNNNYGVICGIGLNINMEPILELNNTSIKHELKINKLDKNIILDKLVDKFMNIYFLNDYSIDFNRLKEYNILNYNKSVDKSIKLIINNIEYTASYVDITNEGALKVLINNQIRNIYSVDKLIL